MTELYRHIGEYTDVPAGDIGVGGREIGYLFGQYKRITNRYESGRAHRQGPRPGAARRCAPRPPATAPSSSPSEMLRHRGDSFDGKRVVVSGSGNVAIYAIEKVHQLGGTSSPAPTPPATSSTRRASTSTCSRRSRRCARVASANTPNVRGGAAYVATAVDLGRAAATSPCRAPRRTSSTATTPDTLVKNGCRARRRGREHADHPRGHRGSSPTPGVLFAPGKAANAGGVATSALEMQQNASRDSWTFEYTEERLGRDHARHPRALRLRPPTSTAPPATTWWAPTSSAFIRSRTRCSRSASSDPFGGRAVWPPRRALTVHSGATYAGPLDCPGPARGSLATLVHRDWFADLVTPLTRTSAHGPELAATHRRPPDGRRRDAGRRSDRHLAPHRPAGHAQPVAGPVGHGASASS